MADLCTVCDERPVDHPATNECHRCLQRRWRLSNQQHNARVGKRGEQKRKADRARTERRRLEREAASVVPSSGKSEASS